MLAGIHLAQMQMGIRNCLAGLYQTYHNVRDILTNLITLFYFKTAGEQLVFQLLWSNINIYIFF